MTFAFVIAFRRLDWAALSWLRALAPRNVGIAIDIRIAMIKTTTMSSISVKP